MMNNPIMDSLSVGKKNYMAFIAIWILSACAIFVPLLLYSSMQHRLTEISQTGIIGNVLRSSVLLKIFEGVSVGSTLPVLVNIFLDKISQASSNSELGNHFFSLFIMCATGIVYLSCYEKDFTAYFYACCLCMKLQTFLSVVAYSTSIGVIATQQKMHSLLFILPALSFAVQVFLSYALLFPESDIVLVRLLLYGFAIICFYLCGLIWLYKCWHHYRINNYHLGFEEQKEVIHMSALYVFATAFMVVSSFDASDKNAFDTHEWVLVAYCIIFVACSIVLTVLPNHLLRTLSDIQEAALKLKREFVRYVSHEIRSPLNVAHAGLEILKAELELTGVTNFVRELLEDIYFASNTAIEILNDMLQYEYIDSGTFKLDMAVMPMVDAFKGRLSAYKFMASKKSISLQIEDHVQVSEYYTPFDDVELGNHAGESEGTPFYHVLYIDKFRVEQIIRNLVSNAIKFTPEGGNITIRFIRTTAAATDHSESMHPVQQLQDDTLVKKMEGYLCVEVVDSGAGIAIENQSKMFNEFTQFNRNHLQGGGGSGLGLWICKNLAGLHGGKINFRSDGEGKGSTFYVEFPYYNRRRVSSPVLQLDTVDTVAKLSPNIASSESSLVARNLFTFPRVFPKMGFPRDVNGANIEVGVAQPPQILIVDDSSANRKIIRRMVESRANAAVFSDVTILEADDGRTALDVMRGQSEAGRSIQLVLMDFIMVHMHGPEAVQKMRTELGYDGIVIGVTGNALPEDLTYFKDHGADLVITKPLTNAKLMDAINIFSTSEINTTTDHVLAGGRREASSSSHWDQPSSVHLSWQDIQMSRSDPVRLVVEDVID